MLCARETNYVVGSFVKKNKYFISSCTFPYCHLPVLCLLLTIAWIWPAWTPRILLFFPGYSFSQSLWCGLMWWIPSLSPQCVFCCMSCKLHCISSPVWFCLEGVLGVDTVLCMVSLQDLFCYCTSVAILICECVCVYVCVCFPFFLLLLFSSLDLLLSIANGPFETLAEFLLYVVSSSPAIRSLCLWR